MKTFEKIKAKAATTKDKVTSSLDTIASGEIEAGHELWRVARAIGDITVWAVYAAGGRTRLPEGLIEESNEVRFAIIRAIVETKVDAVEAKVDEFLDPLPDAIEIPLEHFLGVEKRGDVEPPRAA